MKLLEKIRNNYIVFIIFSFLGWIYETLYFSIKKVKLINRGFLSGPYLPVYGLGAIVLWNLLGRFKKRKHKINNVDITPILLFFMILFIATVLEYICHFVLDEFFNITLWDYSKNAFNLNGRVCLSSSIGFAIGGMLGLYLILPLIEKLIYNKSTVFKNTFALLSLLIVIVDFLIKIL